MILFFVSRKSLQQYFTVLARALNKKNVTAQLLSSKSFSVFSFYYALTIPSALVRQALDYKIAEKKALNQQLSLSKRYFYLLQTRLLMASDIAQLKKYKPSLLVIWNGLKYRQKILVLAAEWLHIKTAFMENGLLPNTTVLDSKGVNQDNSVPRNTDFYKNLSLPPFEFKQLEQRQTEYSKKNSAFELPERYIFIPFQVDNDSQIISFSPWVNNMQMLFDLCRDCVSDYLPLVFKEHPSSPVDYSYLHERQKEGRIVFANGVDTQILIQGASAVITINSTVGIEALSLGKPLFVLGQACYAIEGVAKSVFSKEQLIQLFQQTDPLIYASDAQLVKAFLSYLQNTYLIEGASSCIDDQHITQVCARLMEFL